MIDREKLIEIIWDHVGSDYHSTKQDCGAAADAILAYVAEPTVTVSRPVEEWQPIDENVPKDRPVNVRWVTTYKWTPYKPEGQRQMKAKGRWQCAGEYGGWENAGLPQPGEWSECPPLAARDREDGK